MFGGRIDWWDFFGWRKGFGGLFVGRLFGVVVVVVGLVWWLL